MLFQAFLWVFIHTEKTGDTNQCYQAILEQRMWCHIARFYKKTLHESYIETKLGAKCFIRSVLGLQIPYLTELTPCRGLRKIGTVSRIIFKMVLSGRAWKDNSNQLLWRKTTDNYWFSCTRTNFFIVVYSSPDIPWFLLINNKFGAG